MPTSAAVDAQGVTITYDNGTANIEVRTPDNFEVLKRTFEKPYLSTGSYHYKWFKWFVLGRTVFIIIN